MVDDIFDTNTNPNLKIWYQGYTGLVLYYILQAILLVFIFDCVITDLFRWFCKDRRMHTKRGSNPAVDIQYAQCQWDKTFNIKPSDLT